MSPSMPKLRMVTGPSTGLFSIALVLAGKAHAFLQGRDFVSPSDIKSIAVDVMRHRVIISYEAEAERVTSDDIVRTVLDHCPVP